MQVKIFSISISHGEEVEEELNRFLRSHKILEVDRQMVVMQNSAYWCFAVCYLPGGVPGDKNTSGKQARVDYKKVLDAATFERFNTYRSIRKKVAQAEGVPVYTIFTNHELAEMAKISRPVTSDDLKKIPGIGRSKIEKYASYIIDHEASE